MKDKILAGALLVGTFSMSLFAHAGESHGGNTLGYGGMMGGGNMGFGWLIPLVIVMAFGYFIYNANSNKTKNTSARDLLDERFANGEIDEKEYKERKSILEK